MRAAWLSLVLIGCTVEGGRVEAVKAGVGVTVDEKTQTVTLDATKVPLLPTCGPGQVVRRNSAGIDWECAATLPWASIEGEPSFALATHTHVPGDITGFNASVLGALSGATVAGNVTATGVVTAASLSTAGTVTAESVSAGGTVSAGAFLPGVQVYSAKSTTALNTLTNTTLLDFDGMSVEFTPLSPRNEVIVTFRSLALTSTGGTAVIEAYLDGGQVDDEFWYSGRQHNNWEQVYGMMVLKDVAATSHFFQLRHRVSAASTWRYDQPHYMTLMVYNRP